MSTPAVNGRSLAERALELALDGADDEVASHELRRLAEDARAVRAARRRVRTAAGTTKEQRQEALRLLIVASRTLPPAVSD